MANVPTETSAFSSKDRFLVLKLFTKIRICDYLFKKDTKMEKHDVQNQLQLEYQINTYNPRFNSVSQSCLTVTPWTAAHQASLSFTISQSLLKLVSIESVMPSNNPILCCPLLLRPSIFPCIRVFSNESALHIRWLRVLELQHQHQSFQ